MEISEGSLSPSELQAEYQTVKQLCKIPAAFVKATNSQSWEEVCKNHYILR